MISVFDHPWLGGLFAEPDLSALLGPEATLGHMLEMEAAYSRVLGEVGSVEPALAERASAQILAAEPAMSALRSGMAQDGVVVAALVRELKKAVDAEAQAALHKGLTSQDVMDTATILSLKAANDLLADKLGRLRGDLDLLIERFGDRPLMGRTRMQAALPITVKDRVLAWALPLDNHLDRLAELRPRLECLQFGGAAGDRAASGGKAGEISGRLAAELDLAPTAKSWQAMRDGIAEYASWLSLVSGTLGKMGQDAAIMALQGIDEIRLAGGGGSSAMPHKQNPVSAELLVTLARFNAVQVSAMHQALVHEQERSGAAWSLEWMVLPQMVMATGRGLSLALGLCEAIADLGARG
ncbi:3-carboxy-cis,cis-muconate cycloisomerase [Mangrovicoccus sp. HB161399]|uniref:3-carboxy-cis,cis-muconate cycloisomerase n=1 Tax=Mangrovicoccus sp. HB161399 TaxID=2720392 RepID=UPI0015581196|nr:3-carboxy-cis,cis-muconate cycloisomerase [Mangrovicoccus sp. HB161399]